MGNVFSPVFAFLKQPSMVDFPGYLAVVFFTSGCNFSCRFCHNAELLKARKEGISWIDLDKACLEYKSNWVDGAVLTGGEPTLSEELPELIRFLKSYGFKIKLDTNGSNPEILKKVISDIDYLAMDIKCSLNSYPALTGYHQVNKIQDSIELIKAGNTDYEFRTTIIEAFHNEREISELLPLIKGAKRYTIQPFLPRENLPDQRFTKYPRTSNTHLWKIADLVKSSGAEIMVKNN